MLSFYITNEGRTIQVDCDHDGLANLISVLEEIKAGVLGHIHLRAPSAGGHALCDKTPWGKDAISEVIITLGGDD